MQKKIQYNFICPKKWDELSGNREQRFCSDCSIHVHNLNLEDPDQKEFCGRLHLQAEGTGKLDQSIRSIRVLAAAAVAAGLISILPAQAQTEDSTRQQDDYVVQQDEVRYIIRGRLTDHQSAEPISFGQVYYYDLNGVEHAVTADFNGEFELRIGEQEIGVAIDLYFRCLGYRDMEVVGVRPEGRITYLNAQLTAMRDEIELIGLIVVIEEEDFYFRANFEKDFSGQIWGREEIRRYPGR